ncbi:hypothetical protein D1818_18205 [Aquimarina sp. BL5]|uniref:hypothetical protein n=1 Tax=Aquimarina sp. BL5 TaxID=1714860 RepID=UPI000E4B7B66|nr:hypothetical protein [Aquimarina sp. BL5]AXT52671.1 hypothetical protein D1818_18205 [Aquimarina sp. BL5]RKN11735.1 hypothetical protein D7036_00905 [Aquimarina sp. BL5]
MSIPFLVFVFTLIIAVVIFNHSKNPNAKSIRNVLLVILMVLGTYVVSAITWKLYEDYSEEEVLSEEDAKKQILVAKQKLEDFQKGSAEKELIVDIKNHYKYLENTSSYTLNQYRTRSELFEDYTFKDEIEEELYNYDMDYNSEYFFNISKEKLSDGLPPPIPFWVILYNIYGYSVYEGEDSGEDYDLMEFKNNFFKPEGISTEAYIQEEVITKSLVNYLSQEIRSTGFIENFWEAHKDRVIEFMPSVHMKYDETIKQRIEDLLVIYNQGVLKTPYKSLFKEYNYDDQEFVDEVNLILEDINLSKIDTVKHYYVEDVDRKMELFGFWDRRYTEGNLEVVLKILKEIQ